MNIPKSCDVVVIGGGPGGSMAATFLSQKGYDVVLLEKQKHPRHRIGENIIPTFWKYADLAQVSDKIIAENFLQKSAGIVAWKGSVKKLAFKDFGFSRSALHVERDRFDHILIENAREKGAQVFEEVSVLDTHLNESNQEQNVTYRINEDKTSGQIACRFIVDASGQGAVIGRKLGIRVVDQGFRFMSIWGYFKNSKYMDSDGKIHPWENLRTIPPVTFQCSIPDLGDWGWTWHIPQRDRTSVGLILPIEAMKTAKPTSESWESYFLRKCYEIPYLSQLLENAQYCQGDFGKINDYSYRLTQVAGPGYFMIGDAAGFIDPIFSIGVPLAMYSAYLAAWAIDRCLKNPDSLGQNQALFTKQLQGRYEVSRSLALPRYESGEQVSKLAKTAVQLQSQMEQELMYVVSTMSTRSDNFSDLVTNENGQRVTSDKLQVISELETIVI
ncbi:MAG: NAD(P)/FAD-dependent oxidoreductase [Xenococcus sp. MO_188.B8]|nr:NAD(P)/FAD-dependent oxidoreductase [Xenococcus sp. MO_188.B8]